MSITSHQTLVDACDDSFVRHCEFHPTHESTNARAIEISASEQRLPAIIYAQQQTAGRGRGENVWWATEGALTFSLLLDPEQLGFSLERWGTLSLATAMAVGRTLLEFVPAADVTWKWPNDVFVDGRKVCGILLDVPSSRPPRMVIGVGVNVNNRIQEIASKEQGLGDKAISLADVAGGTLALASVLKQFLADFRDVAAELEKDPLHLSQIWQARDFLLERQVTLKVGDKLVSGTAVGVDATGAIRIDDGAGEIVSIPGGVVVSVA